MNVYFLSGLGADKTVFQFLDLSWCTPVFIDWIPPLKQESLRHYALRLWQSHIPPGALVVGLSFGGMLVTEMAKEDTNLSAVVLSGAKTKQEIPSYYRTGNFLPLHSVVPAAAQRWFMLRIKGMLGIHQQQNIQVYRNLIRRSDTVFNAWAINALLRWDNTTIPSNIVHVHGTHDRILPVKFIQPDITVSKGGHMMVMEQAAEISGLLQQLLTCNTAVIGSGQLSSASPVADHYPA